jgi:hypothetical protein
MSNSTATAPGRMERRARTMRMANVPMRALLRLPFRTPLSSGLMLVRHTGRVTGRTYRQPVSYVRDGDVLLTPGGGRWTRNLRDGDPVELRLDGRRVVARPDLVRDPGDVDELLRRMLARNRRLARFVPFVDADGTIDAEKLVNALDHGFCVVRWNLDAST